jgi:hypothetical protein
VHHSHGHLVLPRSRYMNIDYLFFITCVCSGIRSSMTEIRAPSISPSRRGLRRGKLLVRSLQACSRHTIMNGAEAEGSDTPRPDLG